MLYIIISILCTVVLGFAFKEFQKRDLSVFDIILWNYFFCSLFGFIFYNMSSNYGFNFDDLYIAIVLGALFILGFNWYAQSIQTNGLAMTTVIQKMSVVFTVIVAFFLGENLNKLQMFAVFISIFAIYFLTSPDEKIAKLNKTIFFAAATSTFIEILFIYKNKLSIGDNSNGLVFTSLIFFMAFCFGLLFALAKKQYPQFKSKLLFSGFFLAIPNFASIFFMNLALAQKIPGSIVFPVLNCSVILLSVLISILIYKEKITTKKTIGLILALIALYIISRFL